MDHMRVELKKVKFIAYYFDGKEESAKEFSQKWNCTYVADFMDKDLTSLVFPDGKKCYAGNYVVIDGKQFLTYSKDKFIETFNVLTDYRQRNYSFMSED